jgi:hypothetical protein
LRSEDGVQLIVFFAAIREILKREIYRADKKTFRCSENKGLGWASRSTAQRNRKSIAFGF